MCNGEIINYKKLADKNWDKTKTFLDLAPILRSCAIHLTDGV